MQAKNILLIGASGGVGQQISVALAAQGHRLALHGLNNREGLDELAGRLGNDSKPYLADITIESQVQSLINEVMADFGSIDILINNAGVTRSAMSWKLSAEDWNDTISVNLTGPFLCSKHALAGMRENGWGRIINITSVVAQAGMPGTVAYAASKAGLIGMTKSMAKEVAKKGVTVNALALGYFEAGMLYTIPEEMREGIRETIPMESFGDTATISQTIGFLCSEEAGYITGQTINLNGGLY